MQPRIALPIARRVVRPVWAALVVMTGCAGTGTAFSDTFFWIEGPGETRIAYAHAFVDPIPESASKKPPVTVTLRLAIPNETQETLVIQPDGVRLFDRHDERLVIGEETEALVIPGGEKRKFVISFETQPTAKTDYGALSQFRLGLAGAHGGAVASGEVEFYEEFLGLGEPGDGG